MATDRSLDISSIRFPQMILRPSPDLPEQLARARKRFRLSLAEFAAELHIRPEWLSKIVNGHVQPSYNIGLRLESFLRRNGVDPASFSYTREGVSANVALAGDATQLQVEILALCTALIETAKGDVARLKLIYGKLRELSTHSPKQNPAAEKPQRPPMEKLLKPLGKKTPTTRSSNNPGLPLTTAQPAFGIHTQSEPVPKRPAVFSEKADANNDARQILRRKLIEYRQRHSER